MSTTKRSISVSRTYKHEPEDCARALELLLRTSFDLQASKGGAHDLTNNPIPKTMKNGSQTTEQENT